MTREEYLSDLLKKQGHTIQGFARQIELPTSTLRSILKNVGGASADNIFKICAGLGITADELNEMKNIVISTAPAPLDDTEQELITVFRQLNSDNKIRVIERADSLLSSQNTSTIFRAAKSTDNHPPEIVETTKDFSKIPPTTKKL